MVRREIIDRLSLREPRVLATGFDRPNLCLQVRRHADDAGKRQAVLSATAELAGPVLLYTATRKDAERYAEELSSAGRSTAAYHAGMTARQRDAVHRRFRDDDVEIVAATSAFGMGVDKPNVRAVVHASIPGSLDGYYQQIGRGGRDGDPALALLFYRPEDLAPARYFSSHRPDEELLRAVHTALNTGAPKRLKQLRSALDVRGRRLTAAVNLLEQARVVRSGRNGFTAICTDPVTALARAMDVAASGERVDRSRIEMARGYAEARECRRRNLLAYFGEEVAQPCGNCDNCAETADRPTPVARPAVPVEHREFGSGVVISGESDRVTVLFDDYGYRTLSADVIRQTRVLERR